MKRVFVDTSAIFAHVVAEDRLHARAVPLFRKAATENWNLVTTNSVVCEAYTLFRTHTRDSRTLALGFLDRVEAGAFTIVRVDTLDETRAVSILRSHEDKVYSFCDALSFAVMERLGIEEAMAFDRDFQSYGRFRLL
ncbi:MAG: PIN domain-containing protein [Proteobacteria bacterium]|nr:PIN domain-containing protein [Pseudomonadota bacterium]